MTDHHHAVTVDLHPDDYTMLDLFVDGRERGAGSITVVTPTDERAYHMPADVKHHHFRIPVGGAGTVSVTVRDAVARFAYLSECADILDRGIRFVNMDPAQADWPLEPTPEQIHRRQGRTGAHFEPVCHWMNDPNGLCRFQGRYHLFYQFNPYGWGWEPMHWGHAVSRDLVHWTYLPIVLEPQPVIMGTPELSGGAFSGSAVTVDEAGYPCPGDRAHAIRFYLTRDLETPGDARSMIQYQATCISEDGVHMRAETPVVMRSDDATGLDFRDPKVDCRIAPDSSAIPAKDGRRAWMVVATNMPADRFDVESKRAGIAAQSADGWFAFGLDGAPDEVAPDMTTVPVMVLYSTPLPLSATDAWRYEGPVLADLGHAVSNTYECPDLFELDGRTVAVAALMHYRDRNGRFQPVRWYVGDLVDEGHGPRLAVEHAGWCDFGLGYYATQSFRDDDGRRIVTGWLADYAGARTERPCLANGVMSLPRELHVRDGRLTAKPVAEVYDRLLGDVIEPARTDGAWAATAADGAYYADVRLDDDADFVMTLALGRELEDGTRARLDLVRTQGRTRLTTHGLNCDGGDFDAGIDDVRHVEVFYDHAVAEVFLNDGEAAGTMLFEAAAGPVECRLQADGGVGSFTVRALDPIW